MGKRLGIASVSDKTGIVDFIRELKKFGFEFLSTGGSAKALRAEKIEVTEVSDYTGFPEMMGGRLKTLHPKIHGGILFKRDIESDISAALVHGINPIDMVVVNLYPFEATIAKPGCTFEEAIENIDIGGPTMLRAASKNFKDVIVVVDPADYKKILDEMNLSNGEVSYDTKYYLARKVFAHTAKYDMIISNYLNKLAEPDNIFRPTLNMSYERISSLRYGENPHMKAAVYREPLYAGLSLVDAKILQGKEMSFNNYLDSSAAIDLAKEFGPGSPTAVIVKHNNPCGVAIADTIADAYKKAFETDPISAFGGVIILNRPVDATTAKEILTLFVEIIIAPGFEAEALELLKAKPNIRLLELDITKDATGFDIRKIQGGLLVQEKDTGMVDDLKLCKIATKKMPTEEEYMALAFAWRICKHMKSNAIVYTSKDQTLGIGCGQTSRVDSAKLAASKAANFNILLEGSVIASDAFFPARDGIDVIAKTGATAVIQPGGSIKDTEVIAACDEHNIAMIFTGMRHFRH